MCMHANFKFYAVHDMLKKSTHKLGIKYKVQNDSIWLKSSLRLYIVRTITCSCFNTKADPISR